MVADLEIVHASLNRQRIILENRGGAGIDFIRRDNVARKGRSVQIVYLKAGIWVRAVANLIYVVVIAKLGKIAISHSLVGYCFLTYRLSPVPHAFVVAKEKGAIFEDRSAEGTPKCICT